MLTTATQTSKDEHTKAQTPATVLVVAAPRQGDAGQGANMGTGKSSERIARGEKDGGCTSSMLRRVVSKITQRKTTQCQHFCVPQMLLSRRAPPVRLNTLSKAWRTYRFYSESVDFDDLELFGNFTNLENHIFP